jgi:hypothetical protein
MYLLILGFQRLLFLRLHSLEEVCREGIVFKDLRFDSFVYCINGLLPRHRSLG